jgi:hypothetical protein
MAGGTHTMPAMFEDDDRYGEFDGVQIFDARWEDEEDTDDAADSEPLDANDDDVEAHGGCGGFNAPT